MESLNKAVIILGHILALIISEFVMYCVGIVNTDLYISIPVGISMIGLVVVLGMSMYKIDYSEFHNTFAVFDYHTVIRMIVKSAEGFGTLIGLALTFGVYGIVLMIFPLILGIIGFVIALIVFLIYYFIVMIIFVTVLGYSKMKERAGYAKNTRRCVCPSCGAIFERPIYVCSCGQRYPTANGLDLRPSIHGINHTHCEVCDAKLPVTDRHNKRRLLDAVCPECDAIINAKEAKPYILTLAGPSKSGKTTLAFSAMYAIEKSGKYSYPYSSSYSGSTPKTYSPPYVIDVDVSKKTNRHLVMFDINGSYFSSDENDFGQQPQYGQEDAIFVTIDASAQDAAVKAELAVNEFWQKYHSISQTSLTSTIRVPLHLVVTHKDAIGDPGDVRGYLVSSGFGQLISMLDNSFSSVSYHICDARDTKEVAKVFFDAFVRLDSDVANMFYKA
ncbi:MAG: phage holin family protein [Candidatus Methanomethylophilaceae archaeon]|nr:phage holin family protein [Candidatus Methanomethylophilaceae archaeon]